MKLTLLPWLLLAIGSASASYPGHHQSSKSSQHKSVTAHTKPIRSLPTLYDSHCKTDDDCPDIHCCNLWTNRCVLDPLGNICDIRPTLTKHKTTTHKKSTTHHKTSTKRPSPTTTATHATKSHPVQGLSEPNPSATSQPDTSSAGNEGSPSTSPGNQPNVIDPNNPVTTNVVTTSPQAAAASQTALSSTLSVPGASASSTPSNGGNNGGDTNNLTNSASVSGDITNKKIGIGIGVGVGCVAAIGLVGMAAYRHHERRQQNANFDNDSSDPVSTRWRPQSFMAVLGGVVAKLPRSSSTSSRSSRLRSVLSNLSRNSSNRSHRSDASGPSVGSAPSLARVDEHVSEGQPMRQY